MDEKRLQEIEAQADGSCSGDDRETMLALVAEVRHWREVAHTAAVEVARRGAIIDGSRRPPTDAEIDAHRAAGGAWLVTYTAHYAPGEKFAEVFNDRPELHGLRAGEGGLRGIHWRPVTGDGCPCEWPAVEQESKE